MKGIRKTMRKRDKHKKYEEIKTIINLLQLDAKQYETVMKCIADALGI